MNSIETVNMLLNQILDAKIFYDSTISEETSQASEKYAAFILQSRKCSELSRQQIISFC
jgi:hypothetical protein